MPIKVAGITDATAIAAGGWHSCALQEAGTISCWGRNRSGQLGNGQSTGDFNDDSADSSVPLEVEGIVDATDIATGTSHSCALHQDGTISCWGNNGDGQLGNETDTDSQVPVKILGITDATAITAGWGHSCALHEAGTISCWGNNTFGQLGNGQSTSDFNDDSADSPVPIKVADIANAEAITTSHFHSCALHQDGTISCWGNNSSGQLGNGNWLPQFVSGFGS